jgi:hypothetical protein
MTEYRQLMMGADQDFQAYLKAGKKKHPFKDGEKEWKKVRDLYKKVARVASAHNLWKRGEHIKYPGYRTLMALTYLKWIALVPVRRLEYTDTRYITAAAYKGLTDEDREEVDLGTLELQDGQNLWASEPADPPGLKEHSAQDAADSGSQECERVHLP